MRQITFVISTTLVLFGMQSIAQESTDFSGVWNMDMARSESAHQGTPIGLVTLIIKQTAKELTIETRRSLKDKPTISSETLIFKLDGSENSVGVDQDSKVKVKARWDGLKLITETERNIQGATVTTMHIFSLNANGQELNVDNTLVVQHGYQSRGGNNTGKGTDVFIKSKEISK